MKYDIKRDRRQLYASSDKGFAVVNVPESEYLAVDGEGDPNTAAAYVEAIEALYTVSYAVKFASKNDLGRDFVVGPLEALWDADDPASFVTRDKSAWRWTALIAQPEWITREMVDAGIRKATAKGDRPAVPLVRMLTLTEGASIQIMHLGSYDDEGPTLDRMHHEVMPELGLTFNGLHHEIYLSDARRTAPDKLRTVLRQPVRPV